MWPFFSLSPPIVFNVILFKTVKGGYGQFLESISSSCDHNCLGGTRRTRFWRRLVGAQRYELVGHQSRRTDRYASEDRRSGRWRRLYLRDCDSAYLGCISSSKIFCQL